MTPFFNQSGHSNEPSTSASRRRNSPSRRAAYRGGWRGHDGSSATPPSCEGRASPWCGRYGLTGPRDRRWGSQQASSPCHRPNAPPPLPRHPLRVLRRITQRVSVAVTPRLSLSRTRTSDSARARQSDSGVVMASLPPLPPGTGSQEPCVGAARPGRVPSPCLAVLGLCSSTPSPPRHTLGGGR